MRRISQILLVIAVLFASNINLSYAGSWNGWIYQDPYPTSNTLLAVKFVTPLKGWVAGEQGTILYTEDGGDTWAAQESGTEETLKSICFINEKIGWAVGERGIIIHTNDGGKSWVTLTETKSILLKVLFVDEKEGWSAGRQRILHTTDGGKTWDYRDKGITGTIVSIFFINRNAGWVLAGDDVYRTRDGGVTWEKSALNAEIPPDGMLHLSQIMGWGDITFVDEKQGWAVVGFGSIMHTTDGGKTWKNQYLSGVSSYGLNRISFSDSRTGCTVGSSILCTEDGGKTWQEKLGVTAGSRIRVADFIVELYSVSFAEQGQRVGWAAGLDGQLWKTSDGGKSWKLAGRRDECGGKTFFINDKTGWFFGRYNNTFICRTDDRGLTRRKQEVGFHVRDIFFMDDRTGWVVGKLMEGKDSNKPDKIFGIIKKTTDGGKTWATQFKELLGKEKTEDGLYKIFFINDKSGWASGYKGTILHTDNGGKAWFNQRAKTKDLYLRGIWFIDTKTGWIIGTFNPEGRWTGIILNTKDGGENWNIQRKIKNTGLTGILFTDNKSGWITGQKYEDERGRLLHTADGGAGWLETDSLHSGIGHPIFYDNKRGILTSEKERIILTTDSGKAWKQMRTPVRKYPWHVSELFGAEQKGK